MHTPINDPTILAKKHKAQLEKMWNTIALQVDQNPYEQLKITIHNKQANQTDIDAYKQNTKTELDNLKEDFAKEQRIILDSKVDDAAKTKKLQELYKQFDVCTIIIRDILPLEVDIGEFIPNFIEYDRLGVLNLLDDWGKFWSDQVDSPKDRIRQIVSDAKAKLNLPTEAASDVGIDIQKLAAVLKYNFDQALQQTKRQIPETEKNRLKSEFARQQWAILHTGLTAADTSRNQIIELQRVYKESYSHLASDAESSPKTKTPGLCTTQAEVDADYAKMQSDVEYMKKETASHKPAEEQKAPAQTQKSSASQGTNTATKFSLLTKWFGRKETGAKKETAAKKQPPPRIEDLLITTKSNKQQIENLKNTLNSIPMEEKTNKASPGDEVAALIGVFDKYVEHRFKDYGNLLKSHKGKMKPEKLQALKIYREGMQSIINLAQNNCTSENATEWLNIILAETIRLVINVLAAVKPGDLTKTISPILEKFKIALPHEKTTIPIDEPDIDKPDKLKQLPSFVTTQIGMFNREKNYPVLNDALEAAIQKRFTTEQFQPPDSQKTSVSPPAP